MTTIYSSTPTPLSNSHNFTAICKSIVAQDAVLCQGPNAAFNPSKQRLPSQAEPSHYPQFPHNTNELLGCVSLSSLSLSYPSQPQPSSIDLTLHPLPSSPLSHHYRRPNNPLTTPIKLHPPNNHSSPCLPHSVCRFTCSCRA